MDDTQHVPLWSDERIDSAAMDDWNYSTYYEAARSALRKMRADYEARLAAAERECDTALRSLNLWLEQVEIDTATINKLGIERDNLATAIERATQLHKRQEDELAALAATLATQGEWRWRGDASIEVYGGGMVAIRMQGPFPQGAPQRGEYEIALLLHRRKEANDE